MEELIIVGLLGFCISALILRNANLPDTQDTPVDPDRPEGEEEGEYKTTECTEI